MRSSVVHLSMQIMPMRIRYVALAASLALFGCGGGGGSSGNQSSLATGPNVVDVIVDGSTGTINTPFVSVTLCSPGTNQCVNVDHVLVDTASTGLRIMASLLAPLNLPNANDVNGHALYNCAQFADGYSFGVLKQADVHMASEVANSLTIHAIDDSNQPLPPTNVPGDCSNGAPSINSAASFGANGVIGLSAYREDCGSNCANNVVAGFYYTCTTLPCQGVTVPLPTQLHNPVAAFATNNNGIVLQFQSVGSAGTFAARGALVFGIDTQSNNQTGNAAIIPVDPVTLYFTTLYKGITLSKSLFDSGSNAYFFNDAAFPACPTFAQFYCPGTAQSLSATWMSGTNSGTSGPINFVVANAEALVNNQPTYTAFANLAATLPVGNNAFDWGMPFFYGRSVYVAIEGGSTSAGVGPFVGFK